MRDKDKIQYLQAEYERRRLSRRDFLGYLGAAGLSMGTAGALLTASDRVLAQTPVRGGRLRMGWYTHSANDTMNPNRLTTSLDFHRVYMFCSCLVTYNEDLSAGPDLAESWEASADAKTWTFKLRKGVTFHNGKPLIADDVIYSLNRHRGEKSDSIIKAWMEPITDIKKDGDDTVVITLESGNADLPFILGDMHAAIVPDGFTDFDNIVGTGPFKLKSFKAGVGSLGVRNEGYHFEGRPYLDEVEVFGIGDTAARVNALLAGDVHFISRVDPKSINIINGAPGVTMANAPSSRHLTFPMRADMSPTDNADVRKGLRLLLDREAVLNNIQKGYGAVGNDTPIGPSDRYFCKELPQREQDLDKAAFHFKKAGLKSIDLHTSEAAGGVQSVDMALMMQQAAKKAGLTLNFRREATDGYWKKIWMKKAFHGSNWMPRPTADLRFSLTYIDGAKWNEAAYVDPEFDKLIVAARSTLDGPKRYEIYCEAQKRMWEDGNSIIPLFTDWLDGRSEKLGGWRGHPVMEGDGGKLAEFTWLTS
jgi:peptide/nickel transport system substrate-binding protein